MKRKYIGLFGLIGTSLILGIIFINNMKQTRPIMTLKEKEATKITFDCNIQ